MKESAKEFWEDNWPEEGIQRRTGAFRIIEDAKIARVLEILPEPCTALEVGCGSGHLGAVLADRGFRAVLLDYALPALRCARNSYLHLGGRDRKRYLAGDAWRLPFADSSFGFVGSTGLLEHFEDPLPIVVEMVRVLKPGGRFYADVVPGSFSLLTSLDFYWRWRAPEELEGFYENKMSKDELRRVLNQAGLQSLHIHSAGVLPPRTLPGASRFSPVRWVRDAMLRPESFWRSLDDTWIADWLGFYYFVEATAPEE